MIKSSKLAKILIIYFLIMGLFCRYIEYYSVWKIFSLFLIGAMFLNYKFRKLFVKMHKNIFFVLCILIVIVSSVLSNDSQHTIGNILYILWPLLYIATLCSLAYNYENTIDKLLDKFFLPLNIIFIINLVLIFIQCMGYPILIKDTWIVYNSFYEDLCCGLFGLNGTHEFTTFSLFINIYILSYIQKKNSRKGLYIYLIVLDLILLYLSTQNDNVAMFLLLPGIVALFYILRIHFRTKKVRKIVKKIIKLVIPFVILLLVIMNIPYIKYYMDKYVWVRVNMLINFNRSHYQIVGSNERFAIVFQALSTSSGWLFGRGFGSADFGGGSFFGFGSFGLCSMSSFIMIGGIWFYLMFSLHISREFHYMVEKKYKLDYMGLIVLGLTVFYTLYTILYTSFVSTIWYGFIFMELGFLRRKINEEKIRFLNK